MVTKVKALLKPWGGNDKPAQPDESHGTIESGASYGASDTGLIAAMRLLLAVSALVFIYIDPLEPDRFVTTTYTTLGLYVLYSLAVYILALSQAKAMRTLRAWTHWLDLGWYSLLISLSSGTNSVFFFGFYFAIMVAGFRWGFWSGIRVTVASALAFAVIAGLTTPAPIELNRFLLRPTFLLVIGYMVARRGRFEIDLKRRLSLLKEIMTVSNPRFGTGRTIGMAMERLRLFYDADHCLVVLFSEKSERYTLRRASRADPEASVQAEVIDKELALRMLVPEPHEAIVFSSPAFFGLGNSWAFDTASRERVEFSAKETTGWKRRWPCGAWGQAGATRIPRRSPRHVRRTPGRRGMPGAAYAGRASPKKAGPGIDRRRRMHATVPSPSRWCGRCRNADSRPS